MKKFLSILFALSLVMFNACKDNDSTSEEPEPPVDNEGYEINVTPIFKLIKSGSFEVTVQCEGAWTASCNKQWLNLDKQSDSKGGVVKVTVEAGDRDEAEVEFVSGEHKATLTVIRSDGEEEKHLTISPDGIFMKSGRATVTLHSSSEWIATVPDVEWLQFSPDEGEAGETKIVFNLTAGNKYDQTQIKFENADGKTRTLFISRNPTGTPVTEPTLELQDNVSDEYTQDAGVTPTKLNNAPQNAIKGIFSVSQTAKVYFAKGNLGYNKTTGQFMLAEHQYDRHDAYSGYEFLLSSDSNNPTGRTTTKNLNYQYGSFTLPEIEYCVLDRPNAKMLRAFVEINLNSTPSMRGLLLLPDDWYSRVGIKLQKKYISLETFNRLEEYGAVFFPGIGSVVTINSGTDYQYQEYISGENGYWRNQNRYEGRYTMEFKWSSPAEPNLQFNYYKAKEWINPFYYYTNCLFFAVRLACPAN